MNLPPPILGVVENMSGFACPCCDTIPEIFGAGGGEAMAKDMDVPFLGRIPIDPAVCEACDMGKLHAYYNGNTPSGKAMAAAFDPLLALPEGRTAPASESQRRPTPGLNMAFVALCGPQRCSRNAGNTCASAVSCDGECQPAGGHRPGACCGGPVREVGIRNDAPFDSAVYCWDPADPRYKPTGTLIPGHAR